MRLPIVFAALFLFPFGIHAQDHTLPPDPSVTALPPVTGKGVQIYRCQQQQGSFTWVFLAPEATLYSGENAVGTHGAGPTWHWNDGSGIAGKVLVKQPPPDGTSVPWLLLAATPAPDSRPGGMLTGVTYVRRSETHGGSAPAAGCDPQHPGAEARVPYAAVYTFYKPAERH